MIVIKSAQERNNYFGPDGFVQRTYRKDDDFHFGIAGGEYLQV